MAYITREDGERFVVPSYRDVISVKKPSLLKKEIQLLSADYGEYITLNKKTAEQYEVAFSPESGYLLGESVWSYFKRPVDLIYCEEIPNTSEAILVIVKNSSVYLDGRFPIDSIAEELIIFRSQQNNFEIYIYGEVPIGETLAEGKFALNASSVKSFNVLTEPVFPTLPTVKRFHLQLVDRVLKEQGIGVFPYKPVLAVVITIGLIWMVWIYFTSGRKELPTFVVGVVNPYQLYIDTLASPSPTAQVHQIVTNIRNLYTIPGWVPDTIEYKDGKMQSSMRSLGIKTDVLFSWATAHNAEIQLLPSGFYLNMMSSFPNRVPPDAITSLKEVIAVLIDRLSYVIPGNSVGLGSSTDRGRFSETQVNIIFAGITPETLDLIGQQLKSLPLVFTKATLKVENGSLSGTISLKALGN